MREEQETTMPTNNDNRTAAHNNGHGVMPEEAPVPLASIPASFAENSAPAAPRDAHGLNTPAPGPAAGQAHQEADLKTRNRDQAGNRLGSFYHFNIPTIGDVPLEYTALANAVTLIGERQPIAAADLAHFYDEKLRRAYRRLLAVRAEEEARQDAFNTRVKTIEHDIATQTQRLTQERDAATRADGDSLIALDSPLAEAHQAAAARVAKAGGFYDPANPAPTCVLRHQPRPLEVFAGEMGLPWTPADAGARLIPLWSKLLSALVGVIIGISFGIMAGMLAPDNLGAQPWLLLLFSLVGCIPTLLCKYALYYSGREPSQRYWLGRPWTSWLPFVVVMAGVGLTVLVMDVYVEREGLLANMRLKQMALGITADANSNTAFFCAAILMTFGYVVFNLWEGYLCGRYDACLNRLRAQQEAEFVRADAARREDTTVQQALEAIALVLDLLRHKAMLTARIAAVSSPYEKQMAQAEARRLAEREALPEEATRRVQDQVGNFNGAQAVFDRMFDEARFACEPPASGWRRIWRALFGYRPPRRRSADR